MLFTQIDFNMKKLLPFFIILFLVVFFYSGYLLLTATINLWPTANLIGCSLIIITDLLWFLVLSVLLIELFYNLK